MTIIRAFMQAGLPVFAIIGVLMAAPANAEPPFGDISGAPNFGPAIYADGEVWGTKGLAPFPAPNDHNVQSFDPLYVFPNEEQNAVAEAGPTNPDYNGGRWQVFFVTWNEPPTLLTSDEAIHEAEAMGKLTISGPTGVYFECPLLPSSIGN